MPLKLNVGLSKKIGQPDYGSLGASCHVEVELDQALVFDDVDEFHDRAKRVFAACRQAVQDELARQQGVAHSQEAGGHTKPAVLEWPRQRAKRPPGFAKTTRLCPAAGRADSWAGPTPFGVPGHPDVQQAAGRADQPGRFRADRRAQGYQGRQDRPGRGPEWGRSMSQELLTRDALAKRKGGVWDYISPSRLNTWLACPLKFKLKYIDGIRTPSSPAAFVGKAVHRGLEHFYRHRQLGLNLTPDQVAKRLIDDWDQVVAEEGMQFIATGQEQACQQQALTLVQAYLQARFARRAAATGRRSGCRRALD